MKILMIASDLSLVGGAERVIVNLSNALCQETSSDGNLIQVDILTIAFSNGCVSYQLKNGVSLLRYPYSFSKDDIKALPFIKRFFENAKIILFHKPRLLIKKHKILRTSEILRILAQEYLNKFLAKHCKKYDIVIDQSSGVNYVPSESLSNAKFIRIWHTPLLICESWYENKQPPNSDKYDVWVHLTQTAAKMWSNHKCIRVIPNFLPEIPNENCNYKSKIVLSVGRLSHEKGFLRLLEIWQILLQDKDYENEFKQWKLIIVGEGPQKDEIETKIKALNLQENVFLKPSTIEIYKEYLSASIYAMCSFYESFGMVLAEASSCALPCIAFDIKTGPSDIMAHEKSGFLVSDGDLADFASKLKILMSDENLRREFGCNAKQIVSEKFSKEAILEKWINLFEELQKNEGKCAK